jgi:hypothetical protein
MSRPNIKSVLIRSSNIKRGTIHFESLPRGTTVIQAFCVEVLKRPTDAVWCKARRDVEYPLIASSCRQRAGTFLASSVAVRSRRMRLAVGSWLGSSWLTAGSRTRHRADWKAALARLWRKMLTFFCSASWKLLWTMTKKNWKLWKIWKRDYFWKVLVS